MSHTLNLYTTYDRKAQHYLPPFVVRSDADAIRSFAEAVMTSETPISQYPADFDLLRIGSIDCETGILTPESHPFPLVNGLVCLQNALAERRRYRSITEDGFRDDEEAYQAQSIMASPTAA